jgi:hypothetical protein
LAVAPWSAEKDGPGQIHRIFELAREFDVDIDMHLDVGHSGISTWCAFQGLRLCYRSSGGCGNLQRADTRTGSGGDRAAGAAFENSRQSMAWNLPELMTLN